MFYVFKCESVLMCVSATGTKPDSPAKDEKSTKRARNTTALAKGTKQASCAAKQSAGMASNETQLKKLLAKLELFENQFAPLVSMSCAVLMRVLCVCCLC